MDSTVETDNQSKNSSNSKLHNIVTFTMSTEQITTVDSEEKLLADLEASKTLPLWKQMARLNPPAPSPTTIPNVWKYNSIRANLERAGNLVPAEQAERRVLMLINPARGKYILRSY